MCRVKRSELSWNVLQYCYCLIDILTALETSMKISHWNCSTRVRVRNERDVMCLQHMTSQSCVYTTWRHGHHFGIKGTYFLLPMSFNNNQQQRPHRHFPWNWKAQPFFSCTRKQTFIIYSFLYLPFISQKVIICGYVKFHISTYSNFLIFEEFTVLIFIIYYFIIFTMYIFHHICMN